MSAPFRKCHLCHARSRAGLQDDGLEDRGDVRQAFGRKSCTRHVSAIELSLDNGRQELRDDKRVAVARVVDCDAQQCGGDRGVPLREAQHGEPRLWILAVLTRAFERRRGGGEIAAPQLDLADLIPALTDVQRIQAFQQLHRVA